MADYITLLGADDVRQAGNTISRAAVDMNHAAGQLEGSFQRFYQFMDDWLYRFQEIMEKSNEKEILKKS